MTRLSCVLTVTLLVLAACTAPPPPTLTPAPALTSTPLPALTPTPLPTLTSSPTPTPTPTLAPTSTRVPTPTARPTSTPAPGGATITPDALLAEPPPRPFAYTVVNPEPPRRVPNAVRTFWVTNDTTGKRREITARLRVQTEHVAMWVEENVWHDVRKLEEAALFFETQIYSTTRTAFGPEWTPGVDNDPHIHILHATGLGQGVMGRTSSADEFPRSVYPFSNEAEMITISVEHVEVGSPAYYALLARQFQRLVQWFQDRNEERWVKEGLAGLAVRLNGFDPGQPEQAYLNHPDTPLTAWEDEQAAVQQGDARQGAAYLLAIYFHEHFGDEGTRALVAQPLNGTAGFDAALAELGADLAFEDLFAGWLVANYLDGETGVGAPAAGPGGLPRYGYATLDLERPTPEATYRSYPTTAALSVHQFGADYVVLQGNEDLRIQFTGATATPLLDLHPHGGRYLWWSNRADESLTTLTRAFDLSGVEQATLTYWAWYDVEVGYDYVAVEISTDGGGRWQMLSTPSGTDANPNGNNPGWGYTGQSGGWIQEVIDLAPYTGGEVLVRFAYLTDEAITGAGFALDDVAIPEIGYADDVEGGEAGWEAAGFVRSDNLVPQRYLVLLIGLGDTATVERLPLGENQAAEWTVELGSEGWREAVLVISGLAPLTTHPAPYQLAIEER